MSKFYKLNVKQKGTFRVKVQHSQDINLDLQRLVNSHQKITQFYIEKVKPEQKASADLVNKK